MQKKKSVSGYGFSRRWEWSVDLSGIWLHTGAEKMTEEVKGEPVSFCSSGSEYEKESAEIFTLNGYLDGRAKDFPELKLGWHGENMLFFLVSEKGFERLGIEKEIIYMEVNVKVGRGAESKISDQSHSHRRKSKKDGSGRKWDSASLQIGSAEKNVRPDSWKSDDPREYRNDAAICRTDQLFQCNDYGKIFKKAGTGCDGEYRNDKKAKKEDVFLGRKLVFSLDGSACTDCRNRHPVACQTLYGKAGCIFQISISGRMAGRNQSWYAWDTGWQLLFFQTGRKGSLYAMIWTDEK